MFGVGFVLRIIDVMSSTIAKQYIMLSSEGVQDLGCPNVLTLPSSILHPAYIATMTVKTNNTKVIAKGTSYN